MPIASSGKPDIKNAKSVIQKNMETNYFAINLTSDAILQSFMKCYPLIDILHAIEAPLNTIDYFSLDVDGPEFDILRSIPWSLLNIKVLSVEYRHYPFSTNDAVKGEMIEYMRELGYKHNVLGFDLIFVKKDDAL